jgi:hypothetical protein
VERTEPGAIDRPLRLGEVLAQAIALYGRSAPALVLVGTLQAGAFLLTLVVPWYGQLVVLSLTFVTSFAIVARVAAGDRLGSAATDAARSAALLALLALVVAAPFYAAVFGVEFLIVSMVWLGLTSFAVPVAMLEELPEAGGGLLRRLAHTVRRTLELASADYLHAILVAVVLVLVYLLAGNLLVAALFGFADQGRVAAPAIVQVVLAPFFFLGLTVLYLEQRTRLALRRRVAGAA